MRKILVLAIVAVALTIFNGCQKSDEPVLIDAQPQAVVKPDVYVENGYLAFKNMNSVDSVIQLLSTMNRTEKEAWEQQIGFKSARAAFDALFDEYDKLESYEEFLVFKERNRTKLKFNEMDEDDCSIDYPFATGYFLPVLNSDGIYKVGKSIVKYTMDDQIVIADGDINKLKNLNAFMHDEMVIVMPKLKSTITNGIHSFPEDNPNGTTNPWHRKLNIGGRKLKNELYIDRYLTWESGSVWKSGYYIYLNQHGQKIRWGKWRNYRTKYGITDIKIKVGSGSIFEDIRVHISPERKPSVNFYLNHYEIIKPYNPGYLSIPSVSFAANVTFRGFGFNSSDYYTIENPESYTPAGTNNYPTNNWGWQ